MAESNPEDQSLTSSKFSLHPLPSVEVSQSAYPLDLHTPSPHSSLRRIHTEQRRISDLQPQMQPSTLSTMSPVSNLEKSTLPVDPASAASAVEWASIVEPGTSLGEFNISQSTTPQPTRGRKRRKVAQEDVDFDNIITTVNPKSQNVYAKPAIAIEGEDTMSIATGVRMRARVKMESRSVGAPIKDPTLFSPKKDTDNYSVTSQKVTAARELRHEQMKDPEEAAYIRAQGRDRAAIFQARQKWKKSEEYKIAAADIKAKMLESIRVDVLTSRFNSGESAEFLQARAQIALRHAVYQAELHEEQERAEALAILRKLRGTGTSAVIKDSDDIDELTGLNGEFPAEKDQYQKNTSQRLTVTVKRVEREIWVTGMRDLMEAGDPDPQTTMNNFRNQILDPGHIENFNEIYPYPAVTDQVLEDGASTIAGSQVKTVTTESLQSSDNDEDSLDFIVEAAESGSSGTGDDDDSSEGSFVLELQTEFVPEDNSVHIKDSEQETDLQMT